MHFRPKSLSGCFPILAAIVSLCVAAPAFGEFVHPGLAHSQQAIDFVKSQIEDGKQPWSSAWENLQRSKYASLRWRPEPRAHVERGPSNNPNVGSSDFSRDASAAYTHALHFALSGEEAHARKSAEIIDAWSSTLETISNHDARLLIGMDGIRYCNAAELLRHSWGKWPEESQAKFEEMLRKVWYPVIKDWYPTANGNWDASMIQTMISMGIYLDDQEMYDRAVNYFLKGYGNGAIGNYFMASGECQESGRDQAHTQMGLEFLANACETAWTQGVDLYGALDNRLLKGFEYTAKYNLGYKVPYVPFKSVEGRYHYKRISNEARGRLRPMFEKVYNHYHNRRGLEAPFTKEALMKSRPEEGERISLPWGTLMFADQPSEFPESR